MDLKTYRARSMAEALDRVKTDLGRDAVILHTRTIQRGGVFGVGAKSLVEITATRDARMVAKGVTRSEERGARENSGKAPARPAVGAATLPGNSKRIDAPADFGGELREEVNAIRGMVAQVLRETRCAKTPEVPAELIDYYTGLIGQDVAGELARQILGRVRARLGSSQAAAGANAPKPAPDEIVRRELRACVGEMLPPAAPVKLTATTRPTVVALVGPTGVGKTTTIAKLAANMKLREARRVGLVTIDTYRIAAVEQLRTYAQILDVPLISVAKPEEMRTAIARMADRDLILIDTAGRSQRDEPKIGELKQFLAPAEPDQIHLVLSSVAREETIREAIARFTHVGAKHVIFTKLDEAVGFGVLLNVLQTVDLRLSYLTHGQAVPDDIEVGSAGRVADLIVNGVPRVAGGPRMTTTVAGGVK